MTKSDSDRLAPEKDIVVVDPVCGTALSLDKVAAQEDYKNWAYFFCSESCHQLFLADPERYCEKVVNSPQSRSNKKS